MPRYEDRYSSNTRLYVGHLSSRTRSRDLEHVFGRYGRVRNVDMKRDYAFVDFSDPRDADDARYYLDGKDVDGRRIIVEAAKGIPRGPGGVREYGGRGPVPGTGRCFNCGIDGHWARDCRAGDWKNKCYHCGERGHIERNCPNSPRKLSHKSGRSYSRSPVRSPSPRRGRSRSFSRSRSYSRSRSPVRREREVEYEEWRSRSPSGKSPKRGISPAKTSKHSPVPDDDDGNPRARRSPSPTEDPRGPEQEERYSESPPRENKNRSPSPNGDDTREPEQDYYNDSPMEKNGSPSPLPPPPPIKDDPRELDYNDSPKEKSRSPSPPIKDDPMGLEHEEGYIDNVNEQEEELYRESPKEDSPPSERCDDTPPPYAAANGHDQSPRSPKAETSPGNDDGDAA